MLQMEANRSPWQLDLLFRVSPFIAQVVRKAVCAMAQASGARVDEAQDIELAVGEALANVYYHAYGEIPGKATVHMRSEGGSVEIVVENEGSGLYPDANIPATLPAVGAEGRGLYIMNQLMDAVEILCPTGHGPGTAVRMTKRLAHA